MKRPVAVESASALIDEKIKELGDWRGKMLAKVREIIHKARSREGRSIPSVCSIRRPGDRETFCP